MPILKVEANKLTTESLQAGVIEVLITRGAKDLIALLPFKHFEGDSYTFNRERELPEGTSVGDPYGDSLPGGVGGRTRLAVEIAMLGRNADTAKIDVIGKSNINDLRAQDMVLASKKLAADFVTQVTSGVYDATDTPYNFRGWPSWVELYATDFPEMDFNAGGNALSIPMLRDLTTRFKGEGFDAIYSDRDTANAFYTLLSLQPGNMAEHIMNDNFGRPMLHFNGLPWVVLDSVGEAYSLTSAVSVTGTALTVSAVAAPGYRGLSQQDIGRVVTIGANSATITAVTGPRAATLDGADLDGASNATAEFGRVNVIYAVRFDEEDGVSMVYHKNRGSMKPNTGDYYGPIAGFDAVDLGLLENAPKYRTRIDLYAQQVSHNPFAIARLRNFTLS